MKEVKKIEGLFDTMCQALGEWKHEIDKTVYRHGHPFSIKHSGDERGYLVEVPVDTMLIPCAVDMVRKVSEHGELEVHKCEWNGAPCNEWDYLCNLGESAEEYVLENILWLTRDDLMHIGSDNHDGNVVDIVSFSDVNMYAVHNNGMVEEVVELDDFENDCVEFCVHRYEYSNAVKQVDEHYASEIE